MSAPIFDVTISQLREWDKDPHSPFTLGDDGIWDDLFIVVRSLTVYGSVIGSIRPMPCAYLDWDEALAACADLNAWDLVFAVTQDSLVVAEYEVWHVLETLPESRQALVIACV